MLRSGTVGFAVLFGDGSGWWGLVGGLLGAFWAHSRTLQGALTSRGERTELVGGANAAYPSRHESLVLVGLCR